MNYYKLLIVNYNSIQMNSTEIQIMNMQNTDCANDAHTLLMSFVLDNESY